MIAVDIPRKRIYIRGDLFKAYWWLLRYFNVYYRPDCERAFWMPKPGVLEGQHGWTIEHNPEPLK